MNGQQEDSKTQHWTGQGVGQRSQHDGKYQQTTHDSEGNSLAVVLVAEAFIMNIKERWVCCEGVKECGGKKVDECWQKWAPVDP